MKSKEIETQAQWPVQGTEAVSAINNLSADADRTATIDTFLFAISGDLRSLIYENAPSLLSGDDDRILRQLDEALPSYEGNLTLEDFTLWASDFVKERASRAARLAELMASCQRQVYEAFWRILRSCTDLMDDETIPSLNNELWSLVYENLVTNPEMYGTDTAQPSTLIFKQAFWIARTFKTNRLRELHRKRRNLKVARMYKRRERGLPPLEKGRRIHFPAETAI